MGTHGEARIAYCIGSPDRLYLRPMNARRIRGVALCGLLLSLPSIGQVAPVEVHYVHSENFADVGNHRFSDERIRATYLEQLRGHLVREAARLLASGERLSVSVTELDMAGEFEAWRPPAVDARIVKDIYPPRIDLSFRLAAGDGKVVKEGERLLRDPAFLVSANRYPDDPLRYEKALIDRWLEQELKAR
jgi:Protein of unknown function (DUF3016)